MRVSLRPSRSIVTSTPAPSWLDARDRAAELQIEIRMAAHLLVQDARQLGLLALHPVGMRAWRRRWRRSRTPPAARASWCGTGSVGAFSPCAISGSAAPSVMQHVERRRMEGRGARLLESVGACLEHRHRHAGARQMRRGDEPDRARAGDQDAFVRSSYAGPTRSAAMPALVMMSRYLSISSCMEFLRL